MERGPHHQRRNADSKNSTAQELQLQLMELASFNRFAGPAVAADLRRHRSWWIAALMERFDARDRLVTLRDLPQGHWNADTLLVLTEARFRMPMERLAQRWNPTEVEWLGRRRAGRLLGVPGRFGLQVLRAWWD